MLLSSRRKNANWKKSNGLIDGLHSCELAQLFPYNCVYYNKAYMNPAKICQIYGLRLSQGYIYPVRTSPFYGFFENISADWTL